MLISAERIYCFRECPDTEKPWAAIVRTELDGTSFRGVFPPAEGDYSGAGTAAEATEKAVENLRENMAASGIMHATIFVVET